MNKLRTTRHLSYANVVSTLALVFALGTGGAWAATQIHGKLIKKNTITGNKLKKNTLSSREVNESKLTAVPRALSADSLAGQEPAAFLPAGGTAANSNQLGGIGASGFVQGGGNITSGRFSAPAGAVTPNYVKTIQTPVGEFRFSCDNASAVVSYHNTSEGAADLFRSYITEAGNADVNFDQPATDAAGLGYAVNNGAGAVFLDMRAGKGDRSATMRVGERRAGLTCIWNWEMVQSG